MKKTIILLNIFLLLFPLCGYSSMMLTSDMKAYVYFAEQVAKMEEMLKTIKEKAQTMKEVKKNTMDAINTAKGHYYTAVGTIRWLEDQKKKLQEQPIDMFSEIVGFDVTKEGKSLHEILDNDYTDIHYNNAEWLKAIGKDGRRSLARKDMERIKNLVLQGLMYKFLAKAKRKTEEAKATDVRIESIIKKIDKAENIKESQDINNILQGETVKLLQQILEVFKEFSNIKIRQAYTGYDPKKLQESVTRHKNLEKMRDQGQKPASMDDGFDAFPDIKQLIQNKEGGS